MSHHTLDEELKRRCAALEQQITEQTTRNQLLQCIAKIANEASSIEAAAQFTLDQICGHTGWPVGHVYMDSLDSSNRLIPTTIWHEADDHRLEAFRQATEAACFDLDEGLPGQVAAAGAPAWMVEITPDAAGPRAKAARQAGLVADFAFPIWVGQQVVSVLEFFSNAVIKPDPSFLEMITLIGLQLGRVVERERTQAQVKQREVQLAEVQQIAHLGSWEWDIRSNRLIWSDELYNIYGLDPREFVPSYEGFLEWVHPDDRNHVKEVVETAYDTHRPFDFEHRIIRPDDTVRTLHGRGKVVIDKTGRPVRMVGTGQDITARKQAEEQIRALNVALEQRVTERTAQLQAANRQLTDEITEREKSESSLRLLVEAGRLLSASPDYATRLANVARLAIPHMADWCAVDIIETIEEIETIRRMAVAHVDPAKVALAQELQRRYPPDRNAAVGVPQVLRTGHAELYPEITDAMLESTAHDAEHLRLIRRLEMTSAMIVPLTARGRTLGAMTFVWAESGHHYNKTDLRMAEELAQRAALAVDNARLYHEAHKLNEELEQRVKERTAALQAVNVKLKNEITEREHIEAEIAELQRRLMEGREVERLHLAQELHDGPLQDLHGTLLRLAELESALPDEASVALMAASQATLQQVIQTLRTVCGELRPPALAPFGLEKAIRSHAERFQMMHPSLQVQLDLAPDGQSLSEQMRLALYRIYQQALTNVSRHAAADWATIRLRLSDTEVTLEIEDDGCGFEMPKRLIELARKGHLGLVGAAERTEALQGRLEIKSSPGEGALIRAVVPRREKEREKQL